MNKNEIYVQIYMILEILFRYKIHSFILAKRALSLSLSVRARVCKNIYYYFYRTFYCRKIKIAILT